MPDVTISPNMMMPVPNVGVAPGPAWATDINACLSIIDQHDHSIGTGNQITPLGLDINTDLTFNQNNLTNVRAARFFPQLAPLSLPADVAELYVAGVDLYYNDFSGNIVRITQGGSVTGANGTITGLVPPASASYGFGTFVFQSNVNTAANLDFESAILRNAGANSKGLTLSPPSAMAADFDLILPALPISTKILTLDTSGNIVANYDVDNSTIVVSSNTLQVPAMGITDTQIADNTITSNKLDPALAAKIDQATPTGVISAFGGTSAPTGWLLCDGTSYLRASFSNLFTAIGTAYGTADGTHFNVPDLRGEFLRGVSGASGRDPDASSRTAMNAGGNTGNNIGSVQADVFKSHTHGVKVYISGTTVIFDKVTAQPNDGTLVGTEASDAAGGSETRPINAYVNYIIKT